MLRANRLATSALVAAALTSQARAAVTFYTDESAWNAAVTAGGGSVTTLDLFDKNQVALASEISTPPAHLEILATPTLTFTPANTALAGTFELTMLESTSIRFRDANVDSNRPGIEPADSGLEDFEQRVSGGVTAIAFDLVEAQANTVWELFDASDQLIGSLAIPGAGAPESRFFGAISDTPIVSTRLSHVGAENLAVGRHFFAFPAPTCVGFQPVVSYPTGGQPESVAVADLDGDGDLDMAVANRSTDDVSVLMSNGDGTYAPEVRYAGVGNGAFWVGAGDLDADGDADLAVARVNSPYGLRVMLNNGDGTFVLAAIYATSGQPLTGAMEDFDADGDLDLVLGNNTGDTISVLRNNGNATFAPHVQYPVGDGLFGLGAGDLDGDGDLDVAVANAHDDDVSVLLNNGNGTFAPQVRYPAGDSARRVAIGDLDGDGDLDLAVTNFGDGDVSILMNNGNGTFAPQVRYAVDGSPRAAAAVDLDGDGDLDVAAGSGTTDTVSLLLNDGDGTFAPYVTFGGIDAPTFMAVADLDADGDPDLAVCGFSGVVSVLLNDSSNQAPTAVAGSDQPVRAGDTAFLDGGASFDDNTASELLDYAWSFFSKPAGSTAVLAGDDTAMPSFVADAAGTYVVDLTVTDACGVSSAVDQVEVSSDNMAPTAAAGDDQLVIVGLPMFLDGSGSSDPEMDALTYAWTVTDAPAGSTADLVGDDTDAPMFVPDLAGVYVMTLVVSDPLGPGAPDSVEITASSAEDYSEFQIIAAADVISGLGSGEITTKGNGNALLNFLSQAVAAIQDGDFDKAIDKLEKAIARTDGCPLRGSPDGNGPGRDWITDCTAQEEVYDLLNLALDALAP